jgi:tetratricopeptide (TPR) repeat protein
MTATELRLQGEQHEAATDWRDAVAAYEACLSQVAAGTATDVDEAAVLTALGRCYWNLSEARTAWRTLRRAMSLCEQRGDGVGLGRATAEIMRIWGPPDRQRDMAVRALELLGDRDPLTRGRLLLRIRWWDESPEAKFEEAVRLGEEHGIDELLAVRKEHESWQASNAGDLDRGIELGLEAHEQFARARAYDGACGTLRGLGFGTLEAGQIDRGYALAERAYAYAASVHLSFSAQLALMDMAGVHYARGEFDRVEEVLSRMPAESDFRAQLFRMWMTEDGGLDGRDGDRDAALRMMVDPVVGGGNPSAMGQIHASAAGILYRAGRTDAAESAFRAWLDPALHGPDDDDLFLEPTAMLECLFGLGDAALFEKIQSAFDKREEWSKLPIRFSLLQGRAIDPLRAGVLARLGRHDEAAAFLREGLAWCEREGLRRDAALCREMLSQQ